jgi:hypothetical protein
MRGNSFTRGVALHRDRPCEVAAFRGAVEALVSLQIRRNGDSPLRLVVAVHHMRTSQQRGKAVPVARRVSQGYAQRSLGGPVELVAAPRQKLRGMHRNRRDALGRGGGTSDDIGGQAADRADDPLRRGQLGPVDFFGHNHDRCKSLAGPAAFRLAAQLNVHHARQ